MTIREFIQRISTITRDTFVQQGTNEDLSRIVGFKVAERFLNTFRSDTLYIPNGRHEKTAMKHQEMFEKYQNGASYAELSQQYAMAEAAVRLVIRNIRSTPKPQPIENRLGSHEEE